MSVYYTICWGHLYENYMSLGLDFVSDTSWDEFLFAFSQVYVASRRAIQFKPFKTASGTAWASPLTAPEFYFQSCGACELQRARAECFI